MAYDTPNYLLNFSVPAFNQIFTASGQVLTSTGVALACLSQAAQILSVAGVVTTAGVASTYKLSVQNGATVVAGPLTLAAINVGAFADVASASQNQVAAGAALAISYVSTGTASATQATPVVNLSVAFNPQIS